MRAVSLIGAMTAAIMVAGGVASAGPCEKTLSPSPDSGPDCYVARAGGARCEGMYISPVSGTPIELVSLTHGYLSYDAAHPAVLLVSLDTLSANGGAHIRAVGIPDRLYYQMDTDIAGDNGFSWPVGDVLARQRITSEQVGILAFYSKRGRGSTLRDAMKIGPPVVLEEGRQGDGSGVGI